MPAGISALGRDMAIDLGTANTLVYVRGKGIVLDEPSVVAVDVDSNATIAVGDEAKRMIGRTPTNLNVIRPMRSGVIADFAVTERMLRYFIRRVHTNRHLAKPRLVVAVPSGLTGVERRAVQETCFQAGARAVHLIEEPLAAAIGARLPVHEPLGSLIVDIGGGTTETAIVSLGGIVSRRSARVGGDDLDLAIQSYIKKEYSVAIGERTAEETKIAVGSAFPLPDEPHVELRGRDLVTGLPKTIVVSADEIRRAMAESLAEIVDTVKVTLDSCPPELAGDIMDRGICLSGGGALLRGLDERLRHETGMPVYTADDPLRTVANGVGLCVDSFETMRYVMAADGTTNR